MKAEAGWRRALWSVALSVLALSCSPSQSEQPTEIVAAVTIPTCIALPPYLAPAPSCWQGVDIGSPGATGTQSYAGTTFTITGAGTGIGATDSLHFAYTTLTGDFTLIARIASFTGGTGSSIGLMVRQDTTPTGTEASVFFRPAFPGGTAPYTNNVSMHAPAGNYAAKDSNEFTSLAAPLYLKLVRSGADFAVYRSSNGTIWSQVGGVMSQSGGQFSATGVTDVGFAVASGSSSTVQATIDNITLKYSGSLNYESSWVGDTWTKDSTGYVSGATTALAVAPDGTAIINGWVTELGEPAKIYKNGAVVKPITGSPGGGKSYEGSVATDGSFIYLYSDANDGRHAGIFRTDMTGNNDLQMSFAHLLTSGSPVGSCQVSGVAVGNGELYVSNATTGQVLVANPTQQMYFSDGDNSSNTVSTAPINVGAVTNPAPLAVYQSLRESDWLPYTLPGFTPGATYSVRLHFAVLNSAARAGSYVATLSVQGQNGTQVQSNFDPYVQAGNAVLTASTFTFTNVVALSSGQIYVTISRDTSNTVIVNGIEVLNASGTPVFQLNAGGGNTGTWKSDVNELVDRVIYATRPGPIAVDKRGNLWIVQEGGPFPVTGTFTSTPTWAAIKLYDKSGKDLKKQITDVVNPTALAYDSTLDRLLVAEAGPGQNIRIYTGLTTTPSCTSTFGQSVFSTPPGLVYAPAAGGHARFYSPTGVGIDQNGNIYVASNVDNAGTDLRAFAPSGNLLWSVAALDDTDTGGLLPSIYNGISPDIYTPTKHYALNLGNLGNEWSLYSYLWNPFLYGANPRPNTSGAIVRSLGSQHETVMYTSGQGTVGFVGIYRLSTASGGEQLIPAATYDGTHLWLDANGDGLVQAGETSTGTSFGFQSFDVDTNGNIYLISPTSIRKLNFLGINPTTQVPLYSVANANIVDRTLPASATPFAADEDLVRVKYDASGDSMYVLGGTNFVPNNNGNYTYSSVLTRYDGWASGPLETVFSITLPTPATDPNFMHTTIPYPLGTNFYYNAMDVVSGATSPHGFVFVAEIWGPVHVFDAFSGEQVTVLSSGPEVDGTNGWEDALMGISAGFNESYGEYEVVTENSADRNKDNFFRWNGITDPTQCNALGNGAVSETVLQQAGAVPVGTGGAIANGVYHSYSANAYQGSWLPAGTWVRNSLRVSGNTVQTASLDSMAEGSQNFSIQTTGAAITGTETCTNARDSHGWPFSSYTATPTQLTLYSSAGNYSVTYGLVQ